MDSLGYLLGHVVATMQRQADQMLQERLGIGMAQFRILTVLQQQPGVQQRVIADMLGQTEASISRQVKLLAQRGLLQTMVNTANRRQHAAELTAKGDKLALAAQDIVDDFYDPLFAAMGDKQRQRLLQDMQVLHAETCRVGRSYGCQPSTAEV